MAPVPQAVPAPVDVKGPNTTPLNTNVVSESSSRLGLTPRETPATVEVIDQQTMKDRGIRTVTEAATAAVGVTGGDAPGAASAFSMRGFQFNDINTLYNGIKIGPQGFTSRIMDAGNLEQIEILKGPSSLMSGEGATGGAVNYVTKRPHTGKIQNEAFTSFDSFHGYRAGFGSGGSSAIKGLDYRFDVTRSSLTSFIDDTYSHLTNISGQLNYRPVDNFMVWVAVEKKQDTNRFYYGTPVVSAGFSGPFATKGVVAGNGVTQYPNVTVLGPVTIDSRTLTTTYNVLDNSSGARELWLRGGFDWDVTNAIKFKNQVYSYTTRRHWLNNEYNTFNSTTGLVDRERFYVGHNQKVVGSVTDLIVNANIAGMENRFAAALSASKIEFDPEQDTVFGGDSVSLVDPDRGVYGPLTPEFRNIVLRNVAWSFEDRLKVTPQFALIGGLRSEWISLWRNAINSDGSIVGGYPFSKSWTPTTYRVGYTWEAIPGLVFYSQHATAADAAFANIFNLRPNRPLELTTSRIYETGVKHLFWDKRAEWVFSAFDIERRNVYQSRGGGNAVVAGKVQSKGVELSGAVTPLNGWKLWANVAYVDAKYASFIDSNTGQDFSGRMPPNVPRVVANIGSSYRFATPWPVEFGAIVRHVGNRYVFDDNAVTMLDYTIADAYCFIDIPKLSIMNVEQTRITFRVKNITNKLYAQWVDPGYADQILLGAPRSYEVVASFKF